MHVRRAPGRHQHVLEALAAFLAQRVAHMQDHLVAFLHRFDDLALERDVDFLAQHARSAAQHFGVADVGDGAAARVETHAHAETAQGLAQFEADHAGADHGHRSRQVVPVKHIVAGDDAGADVLELRQAQRRRAGGDDDAPGVDLGMVVDLQRARAGKARVALQAVLGGDGFHGLEHETDEAVAFALHARHHGRAVDPHLTGVHAERTGRVQRVRRVGRGDQELARHAADPGAGGAVVRALDHHGARALRFCRAIGGHAGGAGADDGDIHIQLFHGALSLFLSLLTGKTIRYFTRNRLRYQADRLRATTSRGPSWPAALPSTRAGTPAGPGASWTPPAAGRGPYCARASSSSGSGR